MTADSTRLVMLVGPNPGREYEIAKEITLLGRDQSCDILIADAEVSREHARITKTPQGYLIEDLGSTNGTFVNGERITGARLLVNGSRINLSDNVALSFELAGSEVDTGATIVSRSVQAGTKAETPEGAPAVDRLRPQVEGQAAMPEARSEKKIGPWVYAGCGCLALLAVISAILYWMPASWWCLLLSPLQIIGVSLSGC